MGKVDIKEIVSSNVFPAWQAAMLAQSFVEEQKEITNDPTKTRIRMGLPAMDEYLNPFMAGDLICTLGRPAQGKTLLANYILDKTLKELVTGLEPHKAAILITTEVSVERSALYWMARIAGLSVRKAIRGELANAELDKLGVAALKLGSYPLFLVGHSTQRAKSQRRARPKLTMDALSAAIDYIINDYKDDESGLRIEPQLIVIDYLQRLHKEDRLARSEAMLQWVDWSKNLAFWAGTPVFLQVQADRTVEDQTIKIPALHQGQWTSNIEQSADFAFSVWMPHTARERQLSAIGNLNGMDVDPNMMIVASLKQKEGPAGELFVLHVEPDKLLVREHHLDVHNFENLT